MIEWQALAATCIAVGVKVMLWIVFLHNVWAKGAGHIARGVATVCICTDHVVA